MVAVRCFCLRFRLLFLLIFLFSLFPNHSVSLSEQESLLKLKKSFTNTQKLHNWDPDSGDPLCNWAGVFCENGAISGLHLGKMGLSGTIDTSALQDFTGLRTLSFVDNKFSGKIPEFHLLTLKSLLLTNNNFSGEIKPDYFSRMTRMKKVYLAGNKFTGKIPESLTTLTFLMELSLENNQFSGEIPEFKQKAKLTTFNISNNKLEGPIPQSLTKYSPDAFAGNAGLCGGPLKPCDVTPSPSPSNQSPPSEDDNKKSTTIKIIVGIISGVMLLLILIIIVRKRKKRRDDDFSVLGKEVIHDHVPQRHHDNDVVEVHVPSSTSNRSVGNGNHAEVAPPSGSTKKGKGGHGGKNGMNELLMVNEEKGTFGLPDLMKAAAEVLGNGGLGSAYKALMANGLAVVVKRMREMNRLGRDGFDAEMRRFGRLRHRNILTPLAYLYRREEKLLISEYIPKGSLLYVLHGDRGTAHSELNWPTRLKITRGIARGMEFLHTEFASYDLPHGNLKSSNILLKEDYEPILNDYSLHPLINPSNATQAMFAFKTPEFTDSQQISPKSDVYCLGIVILEILTGKFPSQYLNNGKGGIDVVHWVHSAKAEDREQELLDPEIASNTESVNQMLQLLQIGADCTESDPDRRVDIREAIRRILEI